MPNFRLLHSNYRTGRRSRQLTELELITWLAYQHSADDFGVCPYSVRKLQGDDPWLDRRPTRMIARCLETLIRVGLVQTFEDHGTPYLYQWDWQDWQKIKWPSSTTYPIIPSPLLEKCSPKTLELFSLHVRARNADAYANANAYANAEGGAGGDSLVISPIAFARMQKAFAFPGSRLKVPHVLHRELVGKLGGQEPDRKLREWYEQLNADAESTGEPIPDVFAWLRPKFVTWTSEQVMQAEIDRFKPKGAR